MAVSVAENGDDVRRGVEELHGQGHQIAKVHRARPVLLFLVSPVYERHFSAALRRLAHCRIGCPVQHLLGEGGVAVGVGHFVLRTRYRREHVLERAVGIHEFPMVHKLESEIFALHDGDGLAAIHHPGFLRETKPTVVPANQIEPECVERPDPHRRCCIRAKSGYAFGQFSGSLVRKGQDEYLARIDAFVDEPGHASDQGLGLARPRTGFQQVGCPAMLCRFALLIVQGLRRLDTDFLRPKFDFG